MGIRDLIAGNELRALAGIVAGRLRTIGTVRIRAQYRIGIAAGAKSLSGLLAFGRGGCAKALAPRAAQRQLVDRLEFDTKFWRR